MLSEVEVETPGPRDCDTDCIVMYGGGLTSYEAARRAIDRYGHDTVEIWFADTRMEDEDLYRFNLDVERLLNHNIRVFSQGLDVWEIFYRERFLGNSRVDPCSKFLKRLPLRRALEKQYPNCSCISCGEPWSRSSGETIDVIEIDQTKIKVPVCENCLEIDDDYASSISKINATVEREGNDCTQARLDVRPIEGRVERCSDEGRFVRVVLGMSIVDDCDRLHRARSYWKPFNNWFPLVESPFLNKTKIIEKLRSQGVREPRLYGAGFEHNNCGGFCVKAGLGQMVHLLNTLPERYREHEKKELEFQKFIGSDVTILGETRNGERRNLTLRELRQRAEAGEEFRFKKGTACACLNPVSAETDEIAW